MWRHYARFLPETWRIFVVVDRDDDDCIELRRRMDQVAERFGLVARSRASGNRHSVINRIAIEELEAWFFGDWDAVRKAYPRLPETIPARKKYRDPDAIQNTWEAFEQVLQRKGYFRTGLRKRQAAREVAAHMNPSRNRSASFRAFWKALLELAES